MDKINERMYQANIELVDRNKLLEKDVSILQRRIDTAIEYIEPFYENALDYTEFKEILEILKGEEDGDNR